MVASVFLLISFLLFTSPVSAQGEGQSQGYVQPQQGYIQPPPSVPPPRPRYRPGMGGVQGVRSGNIRLPVQQMTAQPVYLPDPQRAPVSQPSQMPPQPEGQVQPETGLVGGGEPIQQTGIKIFKPEDEHKVTNFDIENPEFDKLNQKEKEELLQRIIVDKKKEDERKRFKLDKHIR